VTTEVDGKSYRLEERVGGILRTLRERANAPFGCDVTRVLLGRPARFSEDPSDDALAEARLPEAARLAGINTRNTLIAVYTLAGFICAVASWILIGRIGAASPLGNQTANLDAITAVVIGGTSLFGGRGSIVGTLVGALIVGIFRNGLALAGVDVLWQEFTVGLLIILAVAIDQWIRKISA